MKQELEIKGTPKTRKHKQEKELRVYNCPYCNYTFKHYVTKVELFNQFGEGSAASTQVKCECGNFLKTW